MTDIVDLFCGAGGWAWGLEYAGASRGGTLGVEVWDDAAATHAESGFPTIHGSVLELDPADYRGIDGLIASPPCQGFSTAGHKRGLKKRKLFLDHLDKCRDGWVEPDEAICQDDLRADLTLEPLRWVDDIRPRWIALEQATTVLALWDYIGSILKGWGYRTWTGILSAEEYGVPQVRQRSILIASLDRQPNRPTPTHGSYENPSQSGSTLFGPEPEPWLSMADALGWGMADRPSYTVCGDLGTKEFGFGWSGTFARDSLRIHRDSRDSALWVPKEDDPDSIAVTIEDLAKLQTFPEGVRWQGILKSRLKQVANAVPPRLACAIIQEANKESDDE